MNAAIKYVPKAIRADHRAGMNAHAPAKLRPRINGDVREEPGAFAQNGILADEVASQQDAMRADLHPLAHRAMRPDIRGGIHLGVGGDDGGGMKTRHWHGLREERLHGASKGHARIGHANDNFGSGRRVLGRNDGRGGALIGGRKNFRRFSKGQVSVPGGVSQGKARQNGRGVAPNFALEALGNLSNSKAH